MSDYEKNPLKAILKLKERSRSLARGHEQAGEKKAAEKKAAEKKTEEKKTAGKKSPENQEAEKKAAGSGAAEKKAAEKKAAEKAAGRKSGGKQEGQASSGKKASVKKPAEAQAEKRAAEKKAAERKTAEKKAAEKKAAEKKAAEKKAAEKKAAEKKAAEKKAAEKKAAEKKTAEKKAAEKKNPEKKAERKSIAKTLRSKAAASLVEAKLSAFRAIPEKSGAKVKIIPLGGLEQIGMNITAFECGNSIVVVDCGIAFPGDDMPGIDCVIPDITYLKDHASMVKGFVITHGHEDHIGALPYILRELNVPVYSTRLTIALIRRKLEEHGLQDSAKLFVVKHGDTVPFGDFNVEFIKTNHSISDSSALAIFSPAGVIFHTGDFKIDYTPVFGEAADLQRMAELGKQGVLALLCDSTNAVRPGFTMSERTVGHTFDIIFSEHQENRIIVATFASNVDRVQQIINTACKYGRKVVVEGRSMVNVISIANELGYIQIPDGTLIDIEELKNYPPEKTVLITTGSQGESMAALSRMAGDNHRKVTIGPKDVVIMSSHPIPGNEKAVDKVINELSIKGAEVIFQDTHVSGHACAEEIKLMYSLLRPRFALPVHGEYRHRKAQVEIAKAMGVPEENILFMNTGDVVELTANSCKVVGEVQSGGILVDGLGVGDVGNVVLKDRQNLAQNGIMIVAFALQRGTCQLLSGPEIVTRGLVYVRDSEELMEEVRTLAEETIDDLLSSGCTDWSKIKNGVRDALGNFFWKRMKRDPVILPIILGVDL